MINKKINNIEICLGIITDTDNTEETVLVFNCDSSVKIYNYDSYNIYTEGKAITFHKAIAMIEFYSSEKMEEVYWFFRGEKRVRKLKNKSKIKWLRQGYSIGFKSFATPVGKGYQRQ